MDLRTLIIDFDSKKDLTQTISYLSGVLAELNEKANIEPPFTLATSRYGYPNGDNPAGPDAEFGCGDCSLELFGEDVGYVAAGHNYANGEFAPCPRCGKEYQVYRDNNEE